MIAVADTSPLHYLVLIGHIGILPRLFGRVIVPEAVVRELQHPNAPPIVTEWSRKLPDWACTLQASTSQTWPGLGQGEAEVLLIGRGINADVVLFDERVATEIAREMGMRVIGTLGILMLAAEAGIIDLRQAVAALLDTNFRASPALLNHVLRGRKS